MLLISVFSGNMKFGSSGECVTNEISNSIPPQKINNPKISANLFPAKFINKFDGRYNAKFLMDITDKNNLKIINGKFDGSIEGNENSSISKKEKISLRLNGGLQKGKGDQ